MKLVSYNKDDQDQLAIFADDLLYDTDLMHPDLPVSMGMFLNYWEDVYSITTAINKKLEEGKVSRQQGIDPDAVDILAPVPHATSCRKAFSFQQKFPGNYPAFYFANHNCFQGPGKILCMPGHLQQLDFEAGVAIVICKAGKNIKAADADGYIGGYMIMNNINARHFLVDNAYPEASASGNDFATPVGPMLVTPDELEPYKIEGKPGHTGNTYNLLIKCLVNGVRVSEGNLADMEYTFAEIIERASYGVQLFPGDIISSGAIGKGSFLALNTVGISSNPGYEEQWLKEGDMVELEIEALGNLINTIVKAEEDSSIPDEENDAE